MINCTECAVELVYSQEKREWQCPQCGKSPEAEKLSGTSVPKEIWHKNYYEVKKKILTLFQEYTITDEHKNIIGFTMQKPLALKKEITVYSDKNKSQEIMKIKKQNLIDLSQTFEIIDPPTNKIIGYAKKSRRASAILTGFQEWAIYDSNDKMIGELLEPFLNKSIRAKHTARYFSGGRTLVLKEGEKELVEINQSIGGNYWKMYCKDLNPEFDRRLLLSVIFLTGSEASGKRESSFGILGTTKKQSLFGLRR